MHNQNGFTLLELLIAAAIIGVLAIFATQTFRKTASDIRVEDALARAKVIAMSTRRFMADYKMAEENLPEASITGVNAPGENPCVHNAISLQNLIECGYLEYQQYASEWRDEDNAHEYKSNFSMWFEQDEDHKATGRVCLKRASDRIEDTATYCTNGESVEKMEE